MSDWETYESSFDEDGQARYEAALKKGNVDEFEAVAKIVKDGRIVSTPKPAEPVPPKKESAFKRKDNFKPNNEAKQTTGDKKDGKGVDGVELKKANDELDKIAKEIRRNTGKIIEFEHKMGVDLLRAKEIAGKYGLWGAFLKKCDLSDRQAQRLMQLAREYNTTNLSYLGNRSKAEALLSIPAEQRETFIKSTHGVKDKNGLSQNKTVSEMTARDIKEILGTYKTGSNTSDGKQVKRVNLPLSEFEKLFPDSLKLSDEKIAAEIIEAVIFYRKNKGKL